MAHGIVKWYDPGKGHGFIAPDGGGADVFLQREALLGDEPLSGDRVVFTWDQAASGPIAKQVRIIAPGDADHAAAEDHVIVPVHEEHLSVSRHEVDLGDVLIHRRVETEPVSTAIDLTHDELSIERVPVNRPVDAAPEIRYDDDAIIVPVLAEELVTTKRLVLKEELHIRRRRVTETTPIEETVRRQVIDIEGRPAPGVTPTIESAPEEEEDTTTS